MRLWIAGLLLSCLALGLPGCGGAQDGPQRHPVRGRVTYKGQPVALGTVTFGPIDAAKGTPEAATIKSGSYTIERGLAAGDYNVLVQAISGSAREHDKNKAAPEKSPIPEKYADAKQSDLKFTVKAASNTADFELKD